MRRGGIFGFISLFTAILLLGAVSAWADTIEVSQPTYLTNNSDYDRNPSIVYDGSQYWLFWTKADSGGVRGQGGYDPDTDTYVVYYKTAATIAGLAAAPETKLALSETNRPANFDQRVVSATYFNGKIYAFVSSGFGASNHSLYYYVYDSGAWNGPTQLIQDTNGNGGAHVNVTSDANRIYIVWEQEGGTSVCYTWDGTTLNGPINISDDNMPRITLVGGTLYVVSIEDGTGDIEVYSAAAAANPTFTHHSTAIPGAGLYDPTIFSDGTDLYVVSAPWDAGNNQQWLIQAKYSGGSWSTAKRVSYGGYKGTYWWDYWPMGFYDGTDLYIFFTTETGSPTFSDAEIAYIKMDWDLTHDHYFWIQNAIDQANAGDIINIASGTYVEDLRIPAGKDNLELKPAAGDTVTIKGVAMTASANWPLVAPNIEILSDGVKIHGFTIQGPDPVAGFYSSGMVIGANNVEIYDNTFEVTNAASWADVSQGIQTYRDGNLPAGKDVSGLNIHDNTFTHHGDGAAGYEAIFINHTNADPNPAGTVTIQNNTFQGKVLRAITTERSKTIIRDNTIITDLAPNTTDPGGTLQGINVKDYDNREQKEVEISGNTIKGSGAGKGFTWGIDVGTTTQTQQDITIIGNTIGGSGNGTGIRVRSNLTGTGVVINFNDIHGNTTGVDASNATGAVPIDAEYNWWGDESGPSGEGPGTGDAVSTNVDFIPWLAGDPQTAENFTDAAGNVFNVDPVGGGFALFVVGSDLKVACTGKGARRTRTGGILIPLTVCNENPKLTIRAASWRPGMTLHVILRSRDPNIRSRWLRLQPDPVNGAALQTPSSSPISSLGKIEVRLRGWGHANQSLEVLAEGAKRLILEAYDLAGRKVWSGEQRGSRLIWRLLDSQGRPVANGVYLYVVTVEGPNGQVVRSQVQKLVVLR